MKIFLHLVLIGLVLSLMSTAPADSADCDDKTSPDLTYQWLQSILEIASKKGIGTSSYKKHIESIENDSSLEQTQKQVALEGVYRALADQMNWSRSAASEKATWSKFARALVDLIPDLKVMPEYSSTFRVSVKVHEDGSFSDLKQLSSSGSADLDKLIMDKISSIRQFPAIPSALIFSSGTQRLLSLHLEYRSGELRLLFYQPYASNSFHQRASAIAICRDRGDLLPRRSRRSGASVSSQYLTLIVYPTDMDMNSLSYPFEDSESRSQWEDYRFPGSHPEIWHRSPE